MAVSPGEAMAIKAVDLALGVARVVTMLDPAVVVYWELGLKVAVLKLESALEVVLVEAVAAMVMKDQSVHAMRGQFNVVGKHRQIQIVHDML